MGTDKLRVNRFVMEQRTGRSILVFINMDVHLVYYVGERWQIENETRGTQKMFTVLYGAQRHVDTS